MPDDTKVERPEWPYAPPQPHNVVLDDQEITHIRVAILLRLHKWSNTADGKLYDECVKAFVHYKDHPSYKFNIAILHKLHEARYGKEGDAQCGQS